MYSRVLHETFENNADCEDNVKEQVDYRRQKRVTKVLIRRIFSSKTIGDRRQYLNSNDEQYWAVWKSKVER